MQCACAVCILHGDLAVLHPLTRMTWAYVRGTAFWPINPSLSLSLSLSFSLSPLPRLSIYLSLSLSLSLLPPPSVSAGCSFRPCR